MDAGRARATALLLLLSDIGLVTGCADRALSALEAAGFSDIHLDGAAWFVCDGYEDGFHFHAKSRELSVRGVVCCSSVTGCHLRF